MNATSGIVQRLGNALLGCAVSVVFLAVPARSAVNSSCVVVAGDFASLQKCVNTAPSVDDTASKDTVIVKVPAGTYDGNASRSQLRINRRKNLWIVGDSTADEATQPRILFQDTVRTYTDLDPGLRADTGAAGTYGQNNGTVWIHESDNIRLVGLLIDGNSSTSKINTTDRIFAYPATLGKSATVEIRGNVGVNVLLSRNVQLRYLSVTNAWNGISIISPNLGGAFAFPDPNDPQEEVVATLPTSRAGRYGNHLIERCRIHDNVFGILFQRDWDISSVIRNNLFWGNYLRHWGDTRTPAGYIRNLETLDKAKRADGSARSLAYTTVGGAFLMTDVALTPYRIHNNTFHNNATIFSGYYKTGTQHLFYNNLVGRPYQFFRRTMDLPVEATNKAYTSFRKAYTQTERTSEMLQYLSEHQRSNRVVAQDSVPANAAVTPNYWGAAGGNFRLYNMRQIRRGPTQYEGWNWRGDARSWSNATGEQDSIAMTWVPDTAAAGTIAQQADTGGIVRWIRHNMWTGARKDTMDPNAGENWCPPWVPFNIRKSLADPLVFRNTGSFDIRWTLGLPLDTVSATTSKSWLVPTATNLGLKGWVGYEGTPTQPLAIGAYDAAGAWAAPQRRLVLRDTLIEAVTDSLVKFKMNVSGQGIEDADIASLEIHQAKFYNDVPVSDTLYNQGPDAAVANATTTRVNSILSSKPWPLPYQFLTTDYNRSGYRVDDSLTKHKLDPDHMFLGRLGAGFRLPDTSLYARAEVVLKATLKDGTVIFSNPGIFMFSRPRFQFDVQVYDAETGKALPKDADGISIIAQARQPLKVVIKAKTVAKLPVPFKGYANLQMGNAGLLHGADGERLQAQQLGAWKVRHPNDTVTPYFAQNDSVSDTLRAMVSPSNGTLIYRAVFMASTGSLLPYFVEGRSAPIKVVSGEIYQVTIDSIYRGTELLTTPDPLVKVDLNGSAGGRRDTILDNGVDTSMNLTNVMKGDTLRVVLQVRDKFGNPVLDTTSAASGLYVQLGHVLAGAGRYPSLATDANTILLDSSGTGVRRLKLGFDKTGRVQAVVYVSQFASPATFSALRASIVDTLGREIGTAGSVRDSGVVDTTWLKTDKAPIGIDWTDAGGVSLAPINGWVGEWYPVRIKMLKNRKGSAFSGTVDISSMAPIRFHPAKGDESVVDSVLFQGDSLSSIVWLRADDSVTGAWIKGQVDSLADSVGGMRFRYPQVAAASFHDRDCDGRIDSLVLRMNGPVAFRPTNGSVAGDTVDVRFPNQYLTPAAFGTPARSHVVLDSILAFAWNPDSVSSSPVFADRVVVGNPLVVGKTIEYRLASLRDLAPPIAVEAFDNQSWSGTMVDSLVVRFSESIAVDAFGKGALPPFRIVRNGTSISMDAFALYRPAVAGGNGWYSFVFRSGSGVFQRGDSLVVDGTDVVDLVGNQSGTSCPNRPIPLVFNPLFQPTQGYVIDVDGDGNADSVHLGFKDSLGTLPDKIFVRWGSPAETLTVTREQLVAMGVKSSDSTITVWTRGWKGQTIIIDGDTIRNAPRTTGPWDSAWFNDGYSREWLADKVPPVVVRARIKWASDPGLSSVVLDTLTVDFSESVTGCGIGTDPIACLSGQGIDGKSKFDSGSTILSAEGSRWVILVPRTNTSLVPGDSLRGRPANQGGGLSDASAWGNLPGSNSAYREILGDPAPPSRGLMLDRDGDGRVDAVLLQYAVAPKASKLPTFEFEWADSSGAAIRLASDSAFPVEPTRWIAVLKSPGQFPATGYAPAGIRLNLGKQLSRTSYVFPVRDSAGAVLKPRADLGASSAKDGVDTVVVWPSEPLRDPTGGVLLEFRRNGSTIPAESVKVASAVAQANGSWKVLIGPGSAYRPGAGDSTRLSTSGSVVDTVASSNRPHPDHPWVPLTGALRVPYASAYRDANKDGRIDNAVFKFASPVTQGTRIRVFDPEGSSSYREFTVGSQDAGKTEIVFDFSSQPWAENVTSLVKSDLGWLLPSTSLDSNVYKGGRFPIADEVEPVIAKARLRYTSDTSSVDTLILDVSEYVKIDLGKAILRYRASGDASDSGLAVFADPRYPLVYDSAKKRLTILLKPFPEGYSNPADGDSLRLSWVGVSDQHGNAPGAKAKWTQVVANKRIFPPIPQLTNPLLSDPTHKAGDMIEGDQFEVVARGSSPGGTEPWLKLDGSGGGWGTIEGGPTYTPSIGGAKENNRGTVLFVQTNVPTLIKYYIYDNMGVFVGEMSKYISQEMLDVLAEKTDSRTGMVDVGILWKGQRSDGRLVGSGVYPIRLIAYREPVEEEREQGRVASYIYNRLVRVGVKLRLEDNW